MHQYRSNARELAALALNRASRTHSLPSRVRCADGTFAHAASAAKSQRAPNTAVAAACQGRRPMGRVRGGCEVMVGHGAHTRRETRGGGARARAGKRTTTRAKAAALGLSQPPTQSTSLRLLLQTLMRHLSSPCIDWRDTQASSIIIIKFGFAGVCWRAATNDRHLRSDLGLVCSSGMMQFCRSIKQRDMIDEIVSSTNETHCDPQHNAQTIERERKVDDDTRERHMRQERA